MADVNLAIVIVVTIIVIAVIVVKINVVDDAIASLLLVLLSFTFS